jgi:hypothetical protein
VETEVTTDEVILAEFEGFAPRSAKELGSVKQNSMLRMAVDWRSPTLPSDADAREESSDRSREAGLFQINVFVH